MKKISRFIGLFGSIFLVFMTSSCVTKESSESSSSEVDTSVYVGLGTFKGLEAYCWRENETWACGLMSGTNRIKTAAEINALPGITLSKMKEVLQTYTNPDVQVLPLFVSRTRQDSELSVQNPSLQNHPEIMSYLCNQLGLTNDRHIATPSVVSYRTLSVEPSSKNNLKRPLEGSYPSGGWIEATTYVLMDADLDLYLNGSLASKSYMFDSENAWTYHFQMPDKDSLVSFVVSSPFYSTF